jgi:hypothetical protein
MKENKKTWFDFAKPDIKLSILKFVKGINVNHIVTLFLSIILFISTLIHQDSWLPQGWELPKVRFLQWSLSLLLIIIFAYHIYLAKKGKWFITGKTFVITAIAFLLLISSILSVYYRPLDAVPVENSYYNFLNSIFNFGNSIQASVFGNIFREQGFITYILILLTCWNLPRFINKKNIHIIFFAIIISALINIFKAFDQYIYLKDVYPELINDGEWIFGNFGQVNFFSGHLLMALVFSFYYLDLFISTLKTQIYLKFKYKILRSKEIYLCGIVISVVLISVISAGVIISRSTWAIALIPLIFIYSLLYLFKDKLKKFPQLFLFITLIIGLCALVIFKLFISKGESHKYRVMIWDGVVDYYINYPIRDPKYENIKDLTLGSGFDTLGDVLYEVNWNDSQNNPQYVDRAHNFFLDIVSNNGIIILCILLIVILYPLKSFKSNYKDREYYFLLMSIYLWVGRSFIHESGIVNLFEFFVLLALIYGIGRKENRE